MINNSHPLWTGAPSPRAVSQPVRSQQALRHGLLGPHRARANEVEPLGHFGSFTEPTLKGHPKPGRPFRLFGHPGPQLKRWTVTDVLVVAGRRL